jgi:hypothetical protein
VIVALFQQVFRTDRPYWLAILVLGAFAVIPSLILAYSIGVLVALVGVDPASLLPELPSDRPGFVVVLVLIAPFLETVLVIVVLKLIRLSVKSPLLSSAISGVGWGIAHGLQAPLWFFGTFWSFFVFSRGYLAWRSISSSHAFAAAWLPHAIQNSVAYALMRVGGGA